MPFTTSFGIYMKWKLDYSIFILYIQFFLDSLEFQVNQQSIHLSLTILKVVLALKAIEELQGDSLRLISESPGVPGTHLIDLRRMKDWDDPGATLWFWTFGPWIKNPAT